MNSYLSNKIKTISCISIILVVFLHSYNFDTKQNGSVILFEKSIFWFIENYISNGLTRIAVPFFFIFSGFLFFLNYNNSLSEIKLKLRKRVKTLFIPYLFWSIFGIIIYLLLQNIPGIKTFFTKELLVDFSLIKWIDTIFINPIPYQLWFVRDLMVLVLLSPFLFLGIKYLKIVTLLLLFSIWIYYDFSVLKNSIEALFFYSLGGYFALNKDKWNIVFLKNYASLLFFLWLIILAFSLMLKFVEYNVIAQTIVHKISIIIGLISVWNVYDLLYVKQEKIINKIIAMSSATFFIYASHEPLLTIVKKILFIILGKKEINYIEIYFIAPILVIILSYFTGNFLKRNFSKFHGIITGNR